MHDPPRLSTQPNTVCVASRAPSPALAPRCCLDHVRSRAGHCSQAFGLFEKGGKEEGARNLGKEGSGSGCLQNNNKNNHAKVLIGDIETRNFSPTIFYSVRLSWHKEDTTPWQVSRLSTQHSLLLYLMHPSYIVIK